ncbi:MAG: CHASE domain-containing protein, partial [Sulfurimonadaceae bacterium]|nr:CHASE domain-containing protein [Sulfurimonadaceae bacterium]
MNPYYRQLKKPSILFLAALLTVFTVLFYLLAKSQADSEIHNSLNSENHHISQIVSDYILHSMLLLTGLEILFESSENVTPEEFANASHKLLSQYEGIQALEWIPVITEAERNLFEKTASKMLARRYRITERSSDNIMIAAANRDLYFPVYYMVPLEGNERALGFDLASEPLRQKALKQSRMECKTIASAPITLVQEQASQKGFLIFTPVLNDEKSCDELLGFVLGVLRYGDLFNDALKVAPNSSEFVINFYDVTDKKTLLHTTNVYDNCITDESYIKTRTFSHAGRTWMVETVAKESYIKSHYPQEPFYILVGGVFTSIIILLIHLIFNYKQEQLTDE